MAQICYSVCKLFSVQSFDVLKKVGDVVQFPPPQITKRSHVPPPPPPFPFPFRIGDEAYCTAVIEEKRFRAKELLLQLPKLNDPQVTVTLLHMCGAYILSSVHPFISSNLAKFDKDIHSCLEECRALQLTDQAWSQASLSISWRGGWDCDPWSSIHCSISRLPQRLI